MARPRPIIVPDEPVHNVYETKDGFVTSGSFLLDLALGGGWATARVVNIVGDRSSGKTLLAIEACANFAQVSPIDRLRYTESEAAFGTDYAQSIGFPLGLDLVPDIDTVERFYEDLKGWLQRSKNNSPGLYVLDSLDALSDEAEKGRELGTATYGTDKARKMSELFRRINNAITDGNCTLFVISQIRDKIGVTFGETKTRSGGRALDFYCSQILWLSEIDKIKQTVSSVERVVGLHVRARVKKNKVGIPFRECDLVIRFGYGIDDQVSMIEWLTKHKVISATEGSGLKADLRKMRDARDQNSVDELDKHLRESTHGRWMDIEEALAPPMRKYQV